MKKLTLIIFIFLFFSKNAFGDYKDDIIFLKIDSSTLKYNSTDYQIDSAPQLINNRTYAPIKYIVEFLGGKIDYIESESKITISLENKNLSVILNEPYAIISNVKTKMQDPAIVINGRTLLPIRFIIENLGLKIDWIDSSKEIKITKRLISFENIEFEKAIRSMLSFDNKTGILESDLSKITELGLSDLNLKNINDMKYFPNIINVDLSNNSISDISVLSNNSKIEVLNLSKNNITNIDSLKSLNKLESLNIGKNSISSISELSNLTNLKNLYIYENNISSLDPIASIVSLERLISFSNIIQSILPLKELINLEYIDLDNNLIKSTSSLELLPKLKYLSIEDNEISDLISIKNLSKLEELYLWDLSNPKDIIEEVNFIESESNKIINMLIKDDMSEIKKALALHDYICATTVFDDRYNSNTEPRESHNPIGVFSNKTAVCDGYSEALHILFSKAGLESNIIVGNANTSENWELHQWNVLIIDKKVLHIDSTFNDTINHNKFSHDYFNLSNDEISIDHKLDFDKYKFLKLESNIINKSYYENNHYNLLLNKIIKNIGQFIIPEIFITLNSNKIFRM